MKILLIGGIILSTYIENKSSYNIAILPLIYMEFTNDSILH